MSRNSRRFAANVALVDAEREYSPDEGFALLKSMRPAKFDETVEVAIRLGVDPKKSDQMVRGVVRLPHGTGRLVRILVFARGERASDALAAGADFVGADDLIEKIKGGWLEFDKCIATPDMMSRVGPVAKILGPRGLMPNPKVGTVTPDITRAVQEEKAGRVEFRVDKAGVLHALVGKLSFAAEHLMSNYGALLEQVWQHRPQTAKGIYVVSIDVSSTMGPAVRLVVDRGRAQATGRRN